MSEDLKGLIEKINEEGVRAAEAKARAIEDEARSAGVDIIKKAKAEADRLLADAKEKIARAEAASKASLEQAGRDFILALRKEIFAMLDTLITSHVHKALPPEELGRIITELIKEHAKEHVIVSLKKEDCDKLEKGFLNELRAHAKKGITLKPSEEIRGGFIISYDSGRSYYDFTDKALAEYIASYLKPRLAEILKTSVK